MTGPYAKGTCRRFRNTFRSLNPGVDYRVKRAFVDFDGHLHAEGEEWVYLGAYYIPQDEGISLFVEIDDEEWIIPLRWAEGYQQDLIDTVDCYIESVSANGKKAASLLQNKVEVGKSSALLAAGS